jgi:hypothetical protein
MKQGHFVKPRRRQVLDDERPGAERGGKIGAIQ